jgi:hypothetical protein
VDTINPKLRLTEQEVEFLVELGILRSNPSAICPDFWEVFYERMKEHTGAEIEEKGQPLVWKSVRTAALFLLERGDMLLQDTLTTSEQMTIRRLSRRIPSSELRNPHDLTPVVTDERLQTLSYNLAQVEGLIEEAKSLGSSGQRQQDWFRRLCQEARRCRCEIVREADLIYHSETLDKGPPALAGRLQDELRGLDIVGESGVTELITGGVLEGPLLFHHLTPKGRATYYMLASTESWAKQQDPLKQPVTSEYGLPKIDTYDFIAWEYFSRFLIGDDLFDYDHEIWSQRDVLNQLGLLPMSPNEAEYGYLPQRYVYGQRKNLVSEGVEFERLRSLERKYLSIVHSDLQSKRNALHSDVLFAIARIIEKERSSLAKTVLRHYRLALNSVLDSANEPMELQHKGRALAYSLRADPIGFIIFYNFVYGDIAPRTKLKKGIPKGRRMLPQKVPISTVLVDMVELIKDAQISHPYDRAAEALNALADDEIFSGNLNEGFDTLTAAGAVVRQEYIKLRRNNDLR